MLICYIPFRLYINKICIVLWFSLLLVFDASHQKYLQIILSLVMVAKWPPFGKELLTLLTIYSLCNNMSTVMTLSFRTDRSGQIGQTQIRLLLEEQSNQGLHCLLFHWHLLD